MLPAFMTHVVLECNLARDSSLVAHPALKKSGLLKRRRPPGGRRGLARRPRQTPRPTVTDAGGACLDLVVHRFQIERPARAAGRGDPSAPCSSWSRASRCIRRGKRRRDLASAPSVKRSLPHRRGLLLTLGRYRHRCVPCGTSSRRSPGTIASTGWMWCCLTPSTASSSGASSTSSRRSSCIKVQSHSSIASSSLGAWDNRSLRMRC